MHHLPLESATVRAQRGEEALWGLREMLLAQAVDELRGANWQRSGSKGRRPKPIERPGVGPKHERFGSQRVPQAEVLGRLAAMAQRADADDEGGE
jgi:hypothetical protein